MSIAAQCPTCRASYQLQPNLLGRTVKCRKCQQAFRVGPADKSVPPAQGNVAETVGPTISAEFAQQVRTAFSAPIPLTQRSWGYRLSVVLVALAMLTLPLLYLALIGVIMYVTWWHLTGHVDMVSDYPGRSLLLSWFRYAAPPALGVILVGFMFKPLFAPSLRRGRVRSLPRQSQPLLFEFVDKICEMVGAPAPERIEVDCDVNAAASYGESLRGIVLGRRLTLTIGLPLVAGFTMRQLAGVLAHEFGHFSQGAGMRLSAMIRWMSAWLADSVYRRDAWDEGLVQATERLPFPFSFILMLVQLAIWFTRRILWCFMIAAHAVGGVLLRQMEFDADRYAARLAGSETLGTTLVRLGELSLASEAMHGDLAQLHRDGKLVDDLPAAILASALRHAGPLQEAMTKSRAAERTRWYHSHPSTNDRIARVERDAEPGIFQLELPASQLFVSYGDICKGVTQDVYRHYFGREAQGSQLVATQKAVAQQDEQQKDLQAIGRYFATEWRWWRPLRWSTSHVAAPTDPRATLRNLKQAIGDVTRLQSEYDQTMIQFADAEMRNRHSELGLLLFRLQAPRRGIELSVPLDSKESLQRTRDKSQREMGRLGDQLVPCEEAFGRRLIGALQLLHVSQVATRVPEASALRKEVARLLPLAGQLSHMLSDFRWIEKQFVTLQLLVGIARRYGGSEAIDDELRDMVREMGRRLPDLLHMVARQEYPFDHAQGKLTVDRFLAPIPPVPGELNSTLTAAASVTDRFPELLGRLLGRLTTIAGTVEKGLSSLDGRGRAS